MWLVGALVACVRGILARTHLFSRDATILLGYHGHGTVVTGRSVTLSSPVRRTSVPCRTSVRAKSGRSTRDNCLDGLVSSSSHLRWLCWSFRQSRLDLQFSTSGLECDVGLIRFLRGLFLQCAKGSNKVQGCVKIDSQT